MTNPTIAAAIAINNTAPAAKSFVRLIASLYSVSYTHLTLPTT